MWESISAILTGGNVAVIACLALAVLVLVKTGTLRLKTRHFQMGVDPRQLERNVLRAQIEHLTDWLRAKEDDVAAWIKDNTDNEPNEYLTRLVLEHLIDEVTAWCLFNHLSLDDKYLRVKESRIRSIVEQDIIMPLQYHDRFEELYRPWVKEMIAFLIDIRTLKNGKDIY